MLLLALQTLAPAFAPVALRIAGAEHAPFLGHASPSFRWSLACGGCKSVVQRCYELRVLDAGTGAAVLSTGRVNSSRLGHEASALGLRSDAAYTWSVVVFGAHSAAAGEVTGVAQASFRSALLRGSDWAGAAWIGGGTALRTGFTLPARKVARATAYVSGAGCFQLSANGEKVAPGVFFEPSWANLPPVRMLYRAYDMTKMLVSGANALGVQTGMCKYGYLGADCPNADPANANCRALILRLNIVFADGTSQNVSSTAAGWKVTTDANPIRYSHLYHGEIYDARLHDASWDTKAWKPSANWTAARD